MSEHKMYTADDFRETAEDILQYSGLDEEVIAAMLRQAADSEEELAKAKRPDACPANPTNKMCYLPGEYYCDVVRYLQKENAKLNLRLKAVVKECEKEKSKWIQAMEYESVVKRSSMVDSYDRILSFA